MVRDERQPRPATESDIKVSCAPSKPLPAHAMLAMIREVWQPPPRSERTVVAAWLICATGSEYTRIGNIGGSCNFNGSSAFPPSSECRPHYWPDRGGRHKGNRLA